MLIAATGFEDLHLPGRIEGGTRAPQIFTPWAVDWGGDAYMRMQSRYSGDNSRGLYLPVKGATNELWMGGYVNWGLNALHRVFVIFLEGNANPVVEVTHYPVGVNINGVSIGGMPNEPEYSDGNLMGSGVWYPFKVRVWREETHGNVEVFLEGQRVLEVADLPELALGEGEFREVGFVGRSTSTSTSVTYVNFEAIWVGTLDYGSPLVPTLLPNLDGFHQEGEVVTAGAETQGYEVTDFNDGTYLNLDGGGRYSFGFNDAQFDEFNPSIIGGLSFNVRFRGPTHVAVFARIDGVDYDLDDARNQTTSIETMTLTSSVHPVTELLWTSAQVKAAEFGIREVVN